MSEVPLYGGGCGAGDKGTLILLLAIGDLTCVVDGLETSRRGLSTGVLRS